MTGFLATISESAADDGKLNGPNSSLPSSPGRPTAVPPEFLVTPFGYFHPDCVIEISDDEEAVDDEIRQRDGSARRALKACEHPAYDHFGNKRHANNQQTNDSSRSLVFPPTIEWAWVEYAYSTTAGPISWLSATWTVPDAPPVSGSQVVYLFPGAQATTSMDFIIQPVLGWNAASDHRWTIASWNCCRNGNSLHSALLPVVPGTALAGYVWGSNCNIQTGVCTGIQVQTSTASGSSTTLNTSSYGYAMDWLVAGALEVYNMDDCRKYPAGRGVTFGNLSFNAVGGGSVAPIWTTTVASALAPECNYSVTNSPASSSVTLNWCTPASPACNGITCGAIPDGCGGSFWCGCSGTGSKCFDTEGWWYSGMECVNNRCVPTSCD
ncbi:hypothetical protein AnaeK_3581 [Anaeromyxobacter sp. K]|nr:hypothetical protein AnaeK_3581 [Anaeromyxobacter sp. K]